MLDFEITVLKHPLSEPQAQVQLDALTHSKKHKEVNLNLLFILVV